MSEVPQGPGITPTFLYYFLGAFAVCTGLATQALHVSIGTGIPSQLGLILGILGGVVGTYFNRSTQVTLPYKGIKQLKNYLEPTLTEMGYTLQQSEDDVLIYQRDQIRQWLSGRIYIYLQGKTATIMSRALHIRDLKKRLKL